MPLLPAAAGSAALPAGSMNRSGAGAGHWWETDSNCQGSMLAVWLLILDCAAALRQLSSGEPLPDTASSS